MSHFYVFASRDPGTGDNYFMNDHSTISAATKEQAWLKAQGCPVGPIVKVPIPKQQRKDRK